MVANTDVTEIVQVKERWKQIDKMFTFKQKSNSDPGLNKYGYVTEHICGRIMKTKERNLKNNDKQTWIW